MHDDQTPPPIESGYFGSEQLSASAVMAEAQTGRTPKRRTRTSREAIPDPADLTDEYHAQRFVDQHGHKLRYCPSKGGWFVFDGTRWRRDDTLTHIRFARETVKSLRGLVGRIKDSSKARMFETAVRRAESVGSITAMTRLSQSDERVVIRPGIFDRHPFLLNCRNGTLDLKTGILRPHNADDLLTKMAPTEFIPDATCPTWDAFLRRIMADDEEMIGYVRRACGYALTGDVSEHCLFLCHGHGSNGKTVLLNTLLSVLGGDYAMTAPHDLLTSLGKHRHPTALADLDGKRFVAIAEPNGGRLDEALVKWLTGGDSIRAHRMHCDSYEFSPEHKLFMASNHKPEVRETGIAIWRRLRLILFGVTIPPEQRDATLGDKLRAEGSGILNWMAKGCLEWQEKGLLVPEKVRQDTSDYRADMDHMSDFISTCCVRGDGCSESANALHVAYNNWCERVGIPHPDRASLKEFALRLDQRGFKSKKTNAARMRVGIALRPVGAS